MSLQLKVTGPDPKVFDEAFIGLEKPMARAATAAIREAGDRAKEAGRASIGRAGFSRRWQNTLRMKVYPQGRESLSAAAHIWHKIFYAGVFERGASIKGSPRLWLPISGAGRLDGRTRMTPANYINKFGRGSLFRLERPGKPPLLMGRPPTEGPRPKRRAERESFKRFTSETYVPLFVGLDQVDIPDKFDVTEAVEDTAAQLPAIYQRHFRSL